ncbi:TetR/AcrR family transcriptional regulator C-terminal domain-containing protein [Streptomyces sp. NPDC048172]|uniref:TetR/AcrR family transcriptional regulator C-terminal domain-containing protein n=1 Tax=Streptomyces sp. NPDC048172 TaxID=3365505 RepID=UPI0037121E60
MSPKRPRQETDALPGAVWLRAPRQASRTGPALSRERITEAAVAALDGGGVPALSMRKLADALNVHATSLYWHVAHRDDLLDLALDAVSGEVALPAGHATWREDVALFMRELRAALLRHPWAAGLTATRPLLGPHALARAEFVHAALVTAGFDGIALASAAALVTQQVTGSVATQTAWPDGAEDRRARGAFAERLREAADRYPTLAAHATPPHSDWDAHFEAGLALLLDGFATGGHRSPGV